MGDADAAYKRTRNERHRRRCQVLGRQGQTGLPDRALPCGAQGPATAKHIGVRHRARYERCGSSDPGDVTESDASAAACCYPDRTNMINNHGHLGQASLRDPADHSPARRVDPNPCPHQHERHSRHRRLTRTPGCAAALHLSPGHSSIGAPGDLQRAAPDHHKIPILPGPQRQAFVRRIRSAAEPDHLL